MTIKRKWMVTGGKLLQWDSMNGWTEHACSQLARDIAVDYEEAINELQKLREALQVLKAAAHER